MREKLDSLLEDIQGSRRKDEQLRLAFDCHKAVSEYYWNAMLQVLVAHYTRHGCVPGKEVTEGIINDVIVYIDTVSENLQEKIREQIKVLIKSVGSL